MKVTNTTDVTQVFGGVTIAPGETVDVGGDSPKPEKKRGRPKKEK